MTNTAITSQTMVTKHGDLVCKWQPKNFGIYYSIWECTSAVLAISLGYNVVTSLCGAQFSVHMSEISMIEITVSIKRR